MEYYDKVIVDGGGSECTMDEDVEDEEDLEDDDTGEADNEEDKMNDVNIDKIFLEDEENDDEDDRISYDQLSKSRWMTLMVGDDGKKVHIDWTTIYMNR